MSRKHLPAARSAASWPRPARPDRAIDILQVSDAPGEAIVGGDHQNVAGLQEFQHGAGRLACLGRRAAPLLRPDRALAGATACPKGVFGGGKSKVNVRITEAGRKMIAE
jgi:hypothetical protein